MSADEISLTLPADEAFHRVAHLVLQGVDPRRILLLTFSRRAAAEMAGDLINLYAERKRRAGHGFPRDCCTSFQ